MLFGSVYPWAYRLAEVLCFALFVLWLLKLRAIAADKAGARIDTGLVRAIGIPSGLMLALIAFQLIPLPPAMLHTLSPSTWQLYQKVYPGWPSTSLNEDVGEAKVQVPTTESSGPLILPTEAEVRHGAKVPFATAAADEEKAESRGAQSAAIGSMAAIFAHRWRPLSVAWPLTLAALIGAIAVVALLFATIFYPVGDGREVKDSFALTRIMLIAILGAGTFVAVVGLAQWATWNGRILWVMVPYDWGAPDLGAAARRASGPFVNPDHFAGYLATIFPLALAGLIFGGFPTRSGSGPATRVMYGFATFLIFTAVALSQSRAGWIGLAIGTSLVVGLVSLRARDGEEQIGKSANRNPLLLAGAIIVSLAVLALIFTGQQGREQTAGRFGETVVRGGLDFHARYSLWSRAPQIFREFPIFGAGMGAWPEIFIRYQPPHPGRMINYAAHDDYLELMVSAGLIGTVLTGWLIFQVGSRLRKALRSVPAHLVPAMAGLISGLIVMATIELVDFDLHIPANLILVTLLAGLGMRIGSAQSPTAAKSFAKADGRWIYLPAAAAILTAIVAMLQRGAPYPYDIRQLTTAADVRSLLYSYPLDPEVHESILREFGSTMTAAERSREIETWAWLDPTGARARDAYAQDLLEHGRRAEAMAQISQSTYVVPDSNEHPYTNPRILPWLEDDQKRAIEGGLKRAVAANLKGGTGALGEYYATLGRNEDRGKLLAGAADKERDPERRAEYLREAGSAYLAVGEPREAEDLFRRAIEADPSDTRNYEGLIAGVLVPHDEFEQARALIEQGSVNGADGCKLALSVATGAERGGRRDIAEQALNHALENDAESYDCTLALGRLYYGDKRYARAMVVLDTATRLKPDSADAYLELATAAEAAYDYDAAAKAYERAAVLAPQNEVVAQSVAAFKRKLAEAADSEPAK